MDHPRVIAERYEVGRLLGRGGMAVVHLARDTRLDRQVAVKMLRADLAEDPTAQSRFRREAQSAAALNHPSIVAVFDTGEDVVDGPHGQARIPYIVMEYVQGNTLRELLRDGSRRDSTATIALPPSARAGREPARHDDGQQTTPLDVDQAVEITAAVLSALQYSHSMGIVHRDIKPANVMLTPTGEVKVMDFGIARAVADTAATMTATQSVIGTAQYLSPEQARGEHVDARSDLYSAGCLLFELLTGRPPFVGDSPVAVAYQHVRETPQPPSLFNPAVGDELDRVVLHALTKDRDHRYPDASAFRDDLLAAVAGRPVAAPPTAATEVLAPVVPAPVPVAVPVTAAPASTVVVEEFDADQPAERSRAGAYLALALGVLAVALLGWLLYTRVLAPPPAATVEVPSVVNTAKAEAKATIEAANLVYAEGPPQASADVPVGAVISQDPAAGAQVHTGSTVTVVLSSGTDTVPVPDLAGLTQQQARDALKAAGLLVGNVTTQDSKDVARDRVISSNPPAGSELARDTEVSLVVSTGQVQLPDVVDMSYLEARDKLLELGLVVEPQYAENSTVDPDTVIGQDPQAGKVDQGSKVVLTVAKAAAPTTPATSASSSSSSSSAPSVSPSPAESPSASVTATP